MEKSETIDVLVKALAAAQKRFKPLKRTATAGGGGKFSYKYAPLDELIDATREALGDNGLVIVQAPTLTPDGYILETRLMHETGQWIGCTLPIDVDQNDRMTGIQAFGSALTYARRYAWGPLVGIAPEEDDDGAGVGKPTTKQVPAASNGQLAVGEGGICPTHGQNREYRTGEKDGKPWAGWFCPALGCRQTKWVNAAVAPAPRVVEGTVAVPSGAPQSTPQTHQEPAASTGPAQAAQGPLATADQESEDDFDNTFPRPDPAETARNNTAAQIRAERQNELVSLAVKKGMTAEGYKSMLFKRYNHELHELSGEELSEEFRRLSAAKDATPKAKA